MPWNLQVTVGSKTGKTGPNKLLQVVCCDRRLTGTPTVYNSSDLNNVCLYCLINCVTLICRLFKV